LLGQVEGNPVVRGEAYLLAGCVEEADRLAQRGASRTPAATKCGEWKHVPWWLLGEIAMRRDPPDVAQAEAHYRQALALAEELGMRPPRGPLPTVASARLYAATSQREQARTELSTAIALYRDMEMQFLVTSDRGGASAGGGTVMDYDAVLAQVLASPAAGAASVVSGPETSGLQPG